MKSEHRHELQTSELAKLAERLRQFSSTYGARVLWIAGTVVCLALAVFIWVKRSQAEKAAAWNRLVACRTPQDFEEVAEDPDLDGTDVARWARLQAAELYLRTGFRQLFTNRPAAVSDLKAARDHFEALLAQESLPATYRERALIGLAHCLEMLSAGDTSAAIEVYEKFVEEFPESLYAEHARQRIEALRTDEAREFYAWFHEQNPKPSDRPGPHDTFGDLDMPPSTLPEIPEALRLPELDRAPEGATDSSDGPPAPPLPDARAGGAENGAARTADPPE